MTQDTLKTHAGSLTGNREKRENQESLEKMYQTEYYWEYATSPQSLHQALMNFFSQTKSPDPDTQARTLLRKTRKQITKLQVREPLDTELLISKGKLTLRQRSNVVEEIWVTDDMEKFATEKLAKARRRSGQKAASRRIATQEIASSRADQADLNEISRQINTTDTNSLSSLDENDPSHKILIQRALPPDLPQLSRTITSEEATNILDYHEALLKNLDLAINVNISAIDEASQTKALAQAGQLIRNIITILEDKRMQTAELTGETYPSAPEHTLETKRVQLLEKARKLLS